MDIEGRVAIVTGAARGIGRGIVERLLEKGAKGVSMLDIIDETGQENCKVLQKTFSEERVMYIHCDVTKQTDLEAAFEKTVNYYGRLDIVCNNAGILNESQWEKMIDINYKAVIRGTYLAVEYMGKSKGGSGGVVINTASFVGLVPFNLCPIYPSTKHAVVGFTRSVALEPKVVENHVRVAAICPGKVDTLLLNAGKAGCNPDYRDAYDTAVAELPSTPIARIVDVITTLIEYPNSSGNVCVVGPNKTTFFDPPEVEF
ncbi:15-hydroxyprostaglandin dehydrogenase [NAD(+)]-like [Ptychodera flava]|uniref:15-hydroxyprostaglandin dehydrogenase [NAD(+)]-like n=1 Tax=Ptychodera flava TaxID=63121 RepID=UPI00396A3418